MVRGVTYLAAYLDGPDGATRAFAHAYCRRQNATFGGVGAVRRGMLPARLAAQGGGLQTYAAATKEVCSGAACPFIAVIECVPAGVEPCPGDAAGTIG